jgi:hypothetical protein
VRICGSRSEGGPNRWLIKIDDYAEVAIPDVWQLWRNPARYKPLKEMGVDPHKLLFKRVPRAIMSPMEGADVCSAFSQAETREP